MRSITSVLPARRTLRLAGRRARRRPAVIASALALGILATAGFSATSPLAATATLASADAPATGDFALASFTTEAPAVETDDATAESVPVSEAASAADDTLAAAEAVTAEIASSGLDVEGDTTIDTAALEIASDRLDDIGATDPLYAPLYVDDVVTLTATVDARVADLRDNLTAAQERKAAEEAAAAEKARREAEAAAAAEAERRAAAPAPAAPAPAPMYAAGGGTGDNSPAGAQASARAMLGGFGWGDDQFGCLVALWNKESGWNYRAYNASSGATGIPQALPGGKMASAGADWQTNAATQVRWGLGYIAGRYGSPCNAWGHSQSVGWY